MLAGEEAKCRRAMPVNYDQIGQVRGNHYRIRRCPSLLYERGRLGMVQGASYLCEHSAFVYEALYSRMFFLACFDRKCLCLCRQATVAISKLPNSLSHYCTTFSGRYIVAYTIIWILHFGSIWIWIALNVGLFLAGVGEVLAITKNRTRSNLLTIIVQAAWLGDEGCSPLPSLTLAHLLWGRLRNSFPKSWKTDFVLVYDPEWSDRCFSFKVVSTVEYLTRNLHRNWKHILLLFR